MLRKAKILWVACCLFSGSMFAQENNIGVMSTLFTTITERQLIDANRYRKGEVVKPVKQVSAPKEVVTLREYIKLKILVSGITRTQSGLNVAWVNGKSYENGSKLKDGTKLIITSKESGEVMLRTPDGKRHTIVVGKVKNIEYIKPIEKR